jgi:GNAT superfamily N-acetyltransferase
LSFGANLPFRSECEKVRLRFEALTAERWPDLEQLFGSKGACGGCWCMAWRKQRADFVKDKGEANRASLKALVDAGSEPGILVYDGDVPVGWCAVAPREAYVFLERSRVLRRLDDAPVWSVSCLFVARGYRNRGVSAGLLRAATEFVRARGGRVVEGYPLEPKKGRLPAPFVWTGLLGAFLKAGFHEMPRWSESRPIVRYEIQR